MVGARAPHHRGVEDPGQAGVGIEGDLVDRADGARRRLREAGCRVGQQIGAVGDVLHQGSAQRDVDHLHAPAHGDGGQAEIDGRPHQRELEPVLDLRAWVVVRALAGAVEVGVDVGTAHEQKGVGMAEQPVRCRVVQVARGHHERLPAGSVDGIEELHAGVGHRVPARHPGPGESTRDDDARRHVTSVEAGPPLRSAQCTASTPRPAPQRPSSTASWPTAWPPAPPSAPPPRPRSCMRPWARASPRAASVWTRRSGASPRSSCRRPSASTVPASSPSSRPRPRWSRPCSMPPSAWGRSRVRAGWRRRARCRPRTRCCGSCPTWPGSRPSPAAAS